MTGKGGGEPLAHENTDGHELHVAPDSGPQELQFPGTVGLCGVRGETLGGSAVAGVRCRERRP